MAAIDRHRDALAHPPIETRPEVRWWLAEGLHTDETLRREIDAAHRLGFGGIEFLAMDEQAVDHARYGWGSEEWVHDSGIVMAETTARGMAVSFTSGTNWSNANLPTITPDDEAAAQELDFVTVDVSAAAPFDGPLPRIDLAAERDSGPLPGERVAPRDQHLVAVVAIAAERTDAHAHAHAHADDDAVAAAPTLDAASTVDLTGEVRDGALTWSPSDDRTWRLFAFWMHGTGQTASPSASVNYTVNYLERAGVDALVDYWRTEVLTPELRAQIARNPRTQMYMDSLELNTWGEGGMFWGPNVAAEFRTRRGYDIAPWLPFLVRSAPFMAASTVYRYEPTDDAAGDVAKVRHDYVETLTDLYIENMLRPFAEFLRGEGIGLRSEISYGLPFELTRPGPEVDGIETESLEFASQIDGYRLLAGPAHLFDKPYSSETGATTRNHMLDHRFYDQIIATQWAAGVTKTVLHGWASTAGAEGMTEWPGHEGMWSMFSERFDLRQPACEFYPLWNDAMGRFQYVLRQGRPRIDVGILRTDHFVDNTSGLAFLGEDGTRIADEDAYGHMWMRDRQNHWWRDLGMQDAGWTYEFLDGALLLHDDVTIDVAGSDADGRDTDGSAVTVQPDGPGYQALIVYQEALDPDVAALLLDRARHGLRVLLVNGVSDLRFLIGHADNVHDRVASRTPGLDGRDDELAATMAELRSLPSVAEIDDQADTLATLRGLGVVGRAEFAEPNEDVLTALREDGDLVHLYAYHFRYERPGTTTVRVALPGHGAVLRIDPWSGRVAPYTGAVDRIGARTVVTLELAPGETALLTLDRTGGAEPTRASRPDATETVASLTGWTLRVESWDDGGLDVIEEDRGLGYVTREVQPRTAVTTIDAGAVDLVPWSEIPAVGPEVSGVGEYRTTYEHEHDATGTARVLLDLGSTCGGLGSVVVGDGPARGFDTSHPVVDITDDLRDGANDVVVRVSSSLNNRLIARGYYDTIRDVVADISGQDGRHVTHVRPYGLVGPVRVLRVATDASAAAVPDSAGAVA